MTEEDKIKLERKEYRMLNAIIGSQEILGRLNCEGLEVFKKLEDSSWQCENCGYIIKVGDR